MIELKYILKDGATLESRRVSEDELRAAIAEVKKAQDELMQLNKFDPLQLYQVVTI